MHKQELSGLEQHGRLAALAYCTRTLSCFFTPLVFMCLVVIFTVLFISKSFIDKQNTSHFVTSDTMMAEKLQILNSNRHQKNENERKRTFGNELSYFSLPVFSPCLCSGHRYHSKLATEHQQKVVTLTARSIYRYHFNHSSITFVTRCNTSTKRSSI